MSTTRFYLYHAALGVMGAAWGISALGSMLAGGVALPSFLFAVGGFGMVVAVAYGVVRTDPAEFAASWVSVGAVVGATLLTLLGVALVSVPSS